VGKEVKTEAGVLDRGAGCGRRLIYGMGGLISTVG